MNKQHMGTFNLLLTFQRYFRWVYLYISIYIYAKNSSWWRSCFIITCFLIDM